jgi:hypothetical protein
MAAALRMTKREDLSHDDRYRITQTQYTPN